MICECEPLKSRRSMHRKANPAKRNTGDAVELLDRMTGDNPELKRLTQTKYRFAPDADGLMTLDA